MKGGRSRTKVIRANVGRAIAAGESGNCVFVELPAMEVVVVLFIFELSIS